MLLQKYYFFVNISALQLTLLTHVAITVACSGGRAKGEPQGSPESLSEWTLQIFCPDSNAGIGGMLYAYPFISHLSDLLAKSKPSDEAVKKLHDCIEKIAVALGHDSTDVFCALLAKLIEQPEEKQTFDRLLEMAEKFAAKHE